MNQKVTLDVELMTAREVAETFRVHQTTLNRWRRDGVLPCIRIGKTLRYRRSDIEQVLEPETAA